MAVKKIKCPCAATLAFLLCEALATEANKALSESAISCPLSSAETHKRKHSAMIRRYVFRAHKADTASLGLGSFFHKTKAKKISWDMYNAKKAAGLAMAPKTSEPSLVCAGKSVQHSNHSFDHLRREVKNMQQLAMAN